jgi:CRP-like cAMP-binding protein
MSHQDVGKNDVLCIQGKEADKLYVLMSGTCCVSIDGKLVGQLRKFDVFGEAAMFTDGEHSKRNATVTAEEDLDVLYLSRSDLQDLMESGEMDENCVQVLQDMANQRKVEDREQKTSNMQPVTRTSLFTKPATKVSDEKASKEEENEESDDTESD